MTTMVAVEARHDIPTTRAYEFRDRRLYQQVAPPVTLRLLRGPLARRVFVVPALAQAPRDLLVAVGHGDGDTLMGYARETVFEPGFHQPSEIAGRIVHLVACETAQKLGRRMVAEGARAFIGYDWVVMLHEEVFDAFMECDTSIDLALLAGATVRQAHEAAHDLFNRHIARLEAAGRLLDAAIMTTHRDSLRSPVTSPAFGDANARL